jgi:hypothetical protein
MRLPGRLRLPPPRFRVCRYKASRYRIDQWGRGEAELGGNPYTIESAFGGVRCGGCSNCSLQCLVSRSIECSVCLLSALRLDLVSGILHDPSGG